MNNKQQSRPRPMALIILDGWGYREDKEANAIAAAKKPNWDHLWDHYPHTLISGCGRCVGLPQGQMGNSEVGHLNMGAGRVVNQDLTRIDLAIENGDFFKNPVLCDAVDKAIQTQKAIHILGLLSAGGVHSQEKHIYAMLKLAKERKANEVYVHAFLDGRDTPPRSAKKSIESLMPHGKLVSMIGRYYAMDRDQRWERVQQAYDLLTLGKADYRTNNLVTGLEEAYQRGETDEFVKPTTIENPVTINDGDVVIFMNYRADRARWGYVKSVYLVIPFLGPTTFRDGTAFFANYYYLTIYPYINPQQDRYALYFTGIIARRAELLRFQDVLNQATVDKYVFMRDAYMQRRAYQIQRNKELGDPYLNQEEKESDNDADKIMPVATPAKDLEH